MKLLGLYICILGQALLVITTATAAVLGEWPLLFVGLGALVVAGMVCLISSRFSIPPEGKCILITLLCAHVVVGMGLDGYRTMGPYDKLLHLAGSAATALVLVRWLRGAQGIGRERGLLAPGVLFPLAGTLTFTLGAVWEIFEYGMDVVGPFRAQLGLADTMQDLVCDLIGSVMGALISWLFGAGDSFKAFRKTLDLPVTGGLKFGAKEAQSDVQEDLHTFSACVGGGNRSFPNQPHFR